MDFKKIDENVIELKKLIILIKHMYSFIGQLSENG